MKRKHLILPALLLGAALLLSACEGLPSITPESAAPAPQLAQLPQAAAAQPEDTAEENYDYTVADDAATVTGFEDAAGSGMFAPPAQLGGAPVQALGDGTGPIAGAGSVHQLDLTALSGYTVSPQAFEGAPIENTVDLTGAAAIGEAAFENTGFVPQLAAADSLAVGRNAFAGAPYAVARAAAEGDTAAFAADAGGLRPGLAGLKVLEKADGQLAAGATAGDAWMQGVEEPGFYTLTATAAEGAGQPGPDGESAQSDPAEGGEPPAYQPVAGTALRVGLNSYDGAGFSGTAFSSASNPIGLSLPIPGYDGTAAYYLAVDGQLAAEPLSVSNGEAQIALPSLPAEGSVIELYAAEGAGESVPVTGITIGGAPGSGAMAVNDTLTLTAEVTPDNATNKTVSWNSSDSGVLAVDAGGTLSALGPGSATITAAATDGSGVSASVTITVQAPAGVPVASVTISGAPAGGKLVYGGTAALAATVKPDNATDKAVTWASSNPAVLAVDAGGGLAARGVGRATITATAADGGGAAGSVEIEVTARPVKVSGITAQDKAYDGTKAATLVFGTARFDGLISGDSLSASATGTFADERPGQGKAVAISGLRLGGASAGNYSLDAGSQQSTVANISQKQLTISAPSLTTEKVYDGNTSAAVKPGTLSGVIGADAGNVTVSATAAYNNPDVGEGKTITVTYTLGGSRAGNYLPPANTVVTNGRITAQGGAGAPASLTPDDVVSHEGDSIVLRGTAGQEYAIGTGGGQYGYYVNGAFTPGWLPADKNGQEVTFSGLAPNTAYTLYTRERYDPNTEAPSAVSGGLEVVVYSAAQQKVVDEAAALEGSGVTDEAGADAVAALTNDYGALPEAERATLDSRENMAQSLANLQQQAGVVNHQSGEAQVSAEGLPWSARLLAAAIKKNSAQWQQLQQDAGDNVLLEANSLTLTDTLTGGAYLPPEGMTLNFALPLPRGAAGQALQVVYTGADGAAARAEPVVEGDRYLFAATATGAFGLAAEGSAASTAGDDTGGGKWPLVLLILLVVLVVAGATVGVVLLIRKRNRGIDDGKGPGGKGPGGGTGGRPAGGGAGGRPAGRSPGGGAGNTTQAYRRGAAEGGRGSRANAGDATQAYRQGKPAGGQGGGQRGSGTQVYRQGSAVGSQNAARRPYDFDQDNTASGWPAAGPAGAEDLPGAEGFTHAEGFVPAEGFAGTDYFADELPGAAMPGGAEGSVQQRLDMFQMPYGGAGTGGAGARPEGGPEAGDTGDIVRQHLGMFQSRGEGPFGEAPAAPADADRTRGFDLAEETPGGEARGDGGIEDRDAEGADDEVDLSGRRG